MSTLGVAAKRFLPRPLYRAMRSARVSREIRRFDRRDHTGTYCGHQLSLRFEDPLAAGWYGHDWTEVLPELTLLKQLGALRPGARVFDLGAHQGVMALIFAREVGARGEVIAVEAEPHNARVAAINAAQNAAQNMTVLHAAVAEADGDVPFAVGLNGQVGETRLGNVKVPAVTIDTLAARFGPPDVVFVDIEGYEGRALRAAGEVLSSGASFFVEVHTDRLVGATAAEIVATFDGRELLLATEPGGDRGTHSFAPFEGTVPDERFYLIAT